MNPHYHMSGPPPPPPGYPMGVEQYGYTQGMQDPWGAPPPPPPGANYPPQPPPPGMLPQDWNQPPIPPPNSELANQTSGVLDDQRYSPTFPDVDEKPDIEEVEQPEPLPPAPPSKWTSAPEPPEITREELERMRDSFGEPLANRNINRCPYIGKWSN
ncbi:hypothetical protein LOD99_15326 [Oopsacas minuta]|uniref:Uncharacterized protein n=1 Tax=Oopsacas minuta TaxID=111878 RepID=A0AAV7KDU2_9METZ|nr:hypothetical protein LOD99_15326 [Oopsacas minuta]